VNRILKKVSLGRSLKILVEKGLVREVKDAGPERVLVGIWLDLDLREDAGCGVACWLRNG
jgi:hypothetical protein